MSQTQPDNSPPDIQQPPLPDGGKIPPLIARGNLQFKRDLPRLLRQAPGKWVAYRGEECLGIASDFRKLYTVADRRGLKDDEFVIRHIEEWDPDEVDPEEYIHE